MRVAALINCIFTACNDSDNLRNLFHVVITYLACNCDILSRCVVFLWEEKCNLMLVITCIVENLDKYQYYSKLYAKFATSNAVRSEFLILSLGGRAYK